MKILGLMMVRNGEDILKNTLDHLADFCDDIFVLNDRSTDNSLSVLKSHRAVTNIFNVSPKISQKPWFFSESSNYNLLYRMADYCQPNWVLLVDQDELVKSTKNIREILASLSKDVTGIKVLRVSSWNDIEYPQMVPLMGKGMSLQGNIWRYFPKLTPGKKFLHNRRLPNEIDNLGEIVTIREIIFEHLGWDSLQKRIEKVKLYQHLDPNNEFNYGVSYDSGLLFGYKLSEIDNLIQDYRKLYKENCK